MATATIPDPYTNFNFLVEIDGITRAAFHECSGFDSTIDVIEHREGGENTTLRKCAGMTKYSNIVLKRGITDDKRSRDRSIVRTAPSLCSTAAAKKSRAGTSFVLGRTSGPDPA
jgi:phage tail-like protein